MSCQDVRTRLHDLVDGDLDPVAAAEVRRHLEGCRDCRNELEALESLLAGAAGLPSSLQPERDLWPGIAARLDRPVSGAGERRRRHSWSARLGAAAAAVVGVAVLLGVLMQDPDRSPEPVSSRGATLAAVARSAAVALGGSDAEFEAARADLLRVLEQREAAMSPETRTAVRDGLSAIDENIVNILAALEDNPGNPKLLRLLAAAYRQELDLLQRAAQLPREA